MDNTKKLTSDSLLKYDPEFIRRTALSPDFYRGGADQSIIDRTSEFKLPGFNIDEYQKRLEKPFNPFDPTLDQQVADTQSRGEQFVAALNQAIVGEAIGGTIEAIGEIMEIFDAKNYKDDIEKKWTNVFTEVGQSIREGARKLTPIYSQHPGKFVPWSFSWWAENAPSIVSTVSLLLPSYAVVKGLSYAAKITKMASGLEKLGMSAKAIQTLGSTASRVGQAGFSRQIENTMESTQVWQEVYDKYIGLGKSEYEAKQAASSAAAATYRADWAMGLMDIAQYTMLPKFRVKAPLTAGVAKEAQALGLTTEAISKLRAKALSATVFQVGEAFEEGWQYIAAEEGKYLADKQAGLAEDVEFDKRIGKYLINGEFLTAASMGMVGGGVFKAVAGRLQGSIEQQRREDVKSYNEKLDHYVDVVKRAHEDGNPEAIKYAGLLLDTNLGGNSIKHGNAQVSLEYLESVVATTKVMPVEEIELQYGTKDKQFIVDMAQERVDNLKELIELTEQATKKHKGLAPYVAESSFLIKHYSKELNQLKDAYPSLISRIEGFDKLSSYGQENIKLNGEIKATEDLISQFEIMLARGEKERTTKDGKVEPAYPNALNLQLRREIAGFEKQLRELQIQEKKLSSDPEYTKDVKKADMNNNYASHLAEVVLNNESIFRNKEHQHFYNRQISYYTSRLEELSKPNKQKSINTKKIIRNELSKINSIEELNQFEEQLNPKEIDFTTMADAVTEKRLEFKKEEEQKNDKVVDELLSQPDLTSQQLQEQFPEGRVSEEKHKAYKERLKQVSETERKRDAEAVPDEEIPIFDETTGEIIEPVSTEPAPVGEIDEDKFNDVVGEEPVTDVKDDIPEGALTPEEAKKQQDALDRMQGKEPVIVEFKPNDKVVINDKRRNLHGKVGIVQQIEKDGKIIVRIGDQLLTINSKNINKVTTEDTEDTKDPSENISGKTLNVEVASAGATNGFNKDNPTDKDYPKRSYVWADGTIRPSGRITPKYKGNVIEYRPDKLEDPNVQEGKEFEFRFIENDWWDEFKSNPKNKVTPENEWERISIGIYEGNLLVGFVQRESKDRKIIYDNLIAGNKVNGTVSGKMFGTHNNVLINIGTKEEPNWVQHFSTTRVMKKRHSLTDKVDPITKNRVWELQVHPLVFIIPTGTSNERTLIPSMEVDPATREVITDQTIGRKDENGVITNDIGHIYVGTTNSHGQLKGFKASTATLSSKAVERVIYLIKNKQGTIAQEIVAINSGVPESMMMSNEEALEYQSLGEVDGDTYFFVNDNITVYYSKTKGTFFQIFNEDFGKEDMKVTRMRVEYKVSKDGKPFFDLVPVMQPNGRDVAKSAAYSGTFNVETDLALMLTKKKHAVDIGLLTGTGTYESKLTGGYDANGNWTGRKYASYFDYIDSVQEGIERPNSTGQQSILAIDGNSDNGTMYNSSQVIFGSIKVNGTTIETIHNITVESVDVIDILEAKSPVGPKENPNETPKDFTARTSKATGIESKRQMTKEQLVEQRKKRNKTTETTETKETLNPMLTNFVEALSAEDINIILNALNKEDHTFLTNIPDLIEQLKETIRRTGEEVTNESIIHKLEEYRQCF